jgi:ketosteroid isomerase-like protein
MNWRSLILMLAVAASCSSSASPSARFPAGDEAAIEAAMKGYVADIRSSDATRIASWWTEDALYIERAEPTVRGRAALDSLPRRLLAETKVIDASVEKDDLAVSGDLAYFLGRYREVLQPRTGAPVHNRGRFVFIWRRQPDGTWTIARSLGADLAKDAAAQPAGKDTMKKSG